MPKPIKIPQRRKRKPVQPTRYRKRVLELTGQDALIEERFDELKDRLATENPWRSQSYADRTKERSNDPFSHPMAYIKRGIYVFVRDLLKVNKGRFLESVVMHQRGPYKPQVSFQENPFHWALFGIREPANALITRNEVLRFGRQLVYAHRHNIAPELLIGFIHQSGGPDTVSAKALDPARREEWFIAQTGASGRNEAS